MLMTLVIFKKKKKILFESITKQFESPSLYSVVA